MVTERANCIFYETINDSLLINRVRQKGMHFKDLKNSHLIHRILLKIGG